MATRPSREGRPAAERTDGARARPTAHALARARHRRAEDERSDRPFRRRVSLQLGLFVGGVLATAFLVLALWQATLAASGRDEERATARFRVRVAEASGAALGPGDGCEVEAELRCRDGELDGVGLLVRCGGAALYDSSASADALSVVDFAAEERDGPHGEGRVVALRYEDTGALERRAQIRFDSLATRATVWRTGGAPFRVTLDVEPWSEPRPGPALLGRGTAEP